MYILFISAVFQVSGGITFSLSLQRTQLEQLATNRSTTRANYTNKCHGKFELQ